MALLRELQDWRLDAASGRAALAAAAEAAKAQAGQGTRTVALSGVRADPAAWALLVQWTVALAQRVRSEADAVEATTLVLRVVRNLCAGGPQQQDAFLAAGLPTTVVGILKTLLHHAPAAASAETVETARTVGLQTLANAATDHPAGLAAVWDAGAVRSEVFRDLAIGGSLKTAGLVAHLVMMAVVGLPSVHGDLVQTSRGISMLAALLRRADALHEDAGPAFDDITRTVGVLACDAPLHRTCNNLFATGQLEELAVLTRMLEALGHSAAAAPAPLFGYDVLEALADLLRRVVWADAGDGEDAHAGRAAPELAALLAGKLGATVNDARLEIGRRLVQVLGHATAHGDPDTVAALQRAQLLQTALELLRAAKAIFPRAQKLALARDNAELEPTYGLQRDLIRLVGNLACRHPGMQQLIVELDGVPLLLDHCNDDDRNPFIREWAILALRNVCDQNPAAQAVVAALNAQQAALSPELARLGVGVELDADGRPRVVRPTL